ncbi:MAG: tRNA (5-methylaminomethyl-2-thiouridine)(34)-methyltransferase MnmD [Planctomycetota bacterium]
MSVSFDEHGRPFSDVYGDVYFSGDGVAETEHVFVTGNDLTQLFAKANATTVVAETGFGTGLNFLVTWRHFAQHRAPGHRLVFVSTERHPMPSDALRQAHAALPAALHERAAQLRAALLESQTSDTLPSLRAAFEDGCVSLHLLHGDAQQSLASHTFEADAWFLDGFSPAKNPAMWSEPLLREVAAHTTPGGTFATYTVAGAVRRGLSAAGFELSRRPGYGRKREMLCGTLTQRANTNIQPCRLTTPPPRSVLVRGAGIAGTCAAAAFARRGAQVTLHDPQGLAGGASGIPAAAVRPRLWLPAEQFVPDAEFVATAFRFTSEWLSQHKGAFRRCGVLLAATSSNDERDLQRRAANPATSDLARWLDAGEARAHVGAKLPFGGAWIERGGVCHPPKLIAGLVHTHDIGLQADGGDRLTADLIVHATGRPDAEARDDRADSDAGSGSGSDIDTCNLRTVRATRGQAMAVRWPDAQQAPASVLCTSGYLSPSQSAGISWLGSTYNRGDEGDDVRRDDDERILAKFASAPAGEWGEALRRADIVARFAAVRATSPNRMPLVGYLKAATDPARPRAAVSLAHGSRGLVSAPLAGELLACVAFAEPLPIARELWRRLAPAAD